MVVQCWRQVTAGCCGQGSGWLGRLWVLSAWLQQVGKMLTPKTTPQFTAETHFKQCKNVGGAKLFWAKFQFPLWRR